MLNKIPKSVSSSDNLITITHTFLENLELGEIYRHPFEDTESLTSIFKLDELFGNIYTSYLEFSDGNLHYPYIDDEQFYDYLIHNHIRGTELTLPLLLPELDWSIPANMRDNLNYILFNVHIQEKIKAVLTLDNILNPKLIDLLEQNLTGFNDIKLVGHLLLEEILPVKKYSYGNLLNFKRPEYIKGFFSMKGTKGDLDYLLKFIGYDSNITYTNKNLHHIESIEALSYDNTTTADEYIDKIIKANNLVESYNEDNLVLNIIAELDSSSFQGLYTTEIEELTSKLANNRMPYGSTFREFNFSGRLVHNYAYKVEETVGTLRRKVSEYNYPTDEIQETFFNSDKRECVDWGQNYYLITNGCSERYIDNTRDIDFENLGYEQSSDLTIASTMKAYAEYDVTDRGEDKLSNSYNICPDYMPNGFIKNYDVCAFIDNKVGEVKFIEPETITDENNITIMENKAIQSDFWLTFSYPIDNNKECYVMNDLIDAHISNLEIRNSDRESTQIYREVTELYNSAVSDNIDSQSFHRNIEEELALVNNEQLYIEQLDVNTLEVVNYVLQDVEEANLLYGGLVINGDNITFKDKDYEIYPYYIGFDYIYYKVKTEN